MTYFTDEQVRLLLRPIHPRRVLQRDGMSYVEGYDIRAELTRVFGFGRWSEEILDQALICEKETKTSKGKDAWYVVYRTRKRLTVHAPDGTEVTHYDGSHVGESTHPVLGEAHGNALTNSETYALRRCAINLGDQFGLSLYNKGSLDPQVRWTLVRPEAPEEKTDTDDVPQVSAEGLEMAEHAEDEGEQVPPGESVPYQSTQDAADVGAIDEDAQTFAEEAGRATLPHQIEDIHRRARVANLVTKSIRNPSSGGVGKLAVYLDWRKKQLEKAVRLDSEDLWAEKVADISDLMEAEAALSDLNDMLSSGAVDEARYKVIAAAIDARLAEVERRAVA